MTFPAGESPEEDPRHTGWEGKADAPAPERSPDLADVGAPAGTQAGDGAAVDVLAGDVWGEIQAMFVDDPRGSVTQAADMVAEAVEAFITTVRERQATLASSWQVGDTDTERLRAAFQEYRSFWTSVTELAIA